MIGFNSTIPTFFVGTSSGANTTGKVGVGTATPQGDFQVGDGGTGKFCVLPGGRVTIGAAQITTGGLYDESFTKLTVDGRIMCKDIVISTTADWPDFVFDSAYKLMPIDVLGEFIKTNHHLPGSKSAVEIEKNGISLAELCKQQQMQIEQMALYIVQIDARLKVLEAAQTNGGK
ncbi:MAG: hypothetical protein HY064_06290 [Bacteroidetes bacterium]|nr:hypothetical protein [Bacteroidota bacterium]